MLKPWSLGLELDPFVHCRPQNAVHHHLWMCLLWYGTDCELLY